MENDILSEGFITVAQACEFLAVSRQTIWKLMKSGELAHTNIGRAKRIPKASVKALAARQLKPVYSGA